MGRYDDEMQAGEFFDLAVEVAASLRQLTGDKWQVERSPHHSDAAYLVRGGFRLDIRTKWDERGKLRITQDLAEFERHFNSEDGTYTEGYTWYDDPKLAVNVSVARGGLAIARDIQRRLLAEAERYYLALVERKASREAYEDRLLALGIKMARAAGLDDSAVREDNRGHTGFEMKYPHHTSYWYPPSATVGVSLSTDTQEREHKLVHIKIENLEPDEAERVLALLRQIIHE